MRGRDGRGITLHGLDGSKDQNFVYLEGRLFPGELALVQEGDWAGIVLHVTVETDHPMFGGSIPALILDDNALYAEAMCRLKRHPEVVITGYLRRNGEGSVLVVARRVRFLEPKELREKAAALLSQWRRSGRIPRRAGELQHAERS